MAGTQRNLKRMSKPPPSIDYNPRELEAIRKAIHAEERARDPTSTAREFKAAAYTLSLVNDEERTRILKDHGGGKRRLEDVHPSLYVAVWSAANAVLEEQRRRSQADDDERFETAKPDGFDDANG